MPYPTPMELVEKDFTYYPPTDETKPKYEKTEAAAQKCRAEVLHVLQLGIVAPKSFQTITKATKHFAEVLATEGVAGPDLSSAIRHASMARMMANKGLAQAGRRRQFIESFENELECAHMEANKSIAIHYGTK